MTLFQTLIIIDFIFLGFASNGQERNIDEILKMPDDTNKVNALIAESRVFSKANNIDSALVINHHALNISDQLNFLSHLESAYNNEYQLLLQQDKSSAALQSLRNSLQKFRDKKYWKGFSYSLRNFAIYYGSKGNYEQALKFGKYCLYFADSASDPIRYLGALNNVGGYYNAMGDYDQGIQYLLRAFKIAEAVNDTFRITTISTNIASQFMSLGNAVKAKEYLYRSIEYQKVSDSSNLYKPYAGLGYVFLMLDAEYDSSLYYYHAAEPLAIEMGDILQLGRIYHNISEAYGSKDLEDSAIYYSEKALRIALDENNIESIAGDYISIGSRYKYKAEKTGNKSYLNKAKGYFSKALEYARESESFEQIKVAYLYMSDIHEATGDYKSAYQYRVSYDSLKYKRINEDILKNTAELEAKYQTEKKDKEIVENKLQLKQQDLELTKKSSTNKMLLAGVAMLLLLVVFGSITFVQRQKLLQKQKEAEKQKAVEQTRAFIAGDLHDDIGATLSSVQIMSSFAVNAIDNSTGDAKQWVQKIGENTGDMLQNIRDIVWTLNPANDNAEELILRMKQFATQILEPSNIQYTFTTDEMVIQYLNELIAKRNVFLILKEVLNNAAKYSNASNVTIELKMQNAGCRMNISDNGKGFDTSAISSGNGLKSLKKRAEQLNGTIEVNSSDLSGTTVTLVC